MRDLGGKEGPKQNLLSFLWGVSRYAVFSEFAFATAVYVSEPWIGVRLSWVSTQAQSLSQPLWDSVSSAIQ